MKFPFVSRAMFDEWRQIKNAIIETQTKDIADLKAEVHKLHDAIYLKNCGFQLFGSLPGFPEYASAEPEPELTPEQVLENEAASIELREKERLATIRRTRPSQLAPAMMEVTQARAQRHANAANPSHKVTQMFSDAKAQVTNGK